MLQDYDGQGATRPSRNQSRGAGDDACQRIFLMENFVPNSEMEFLHWRSAAACSRHRLCRVLAETEFIGVPAAARSTIQKPVEFRAFIRQSKLLRVGHPRSVPFGQHALKLRWTGDDYKPVVAFKSRRAAFCDFPLPDFHRSVDCGRLAIAASNAKRSSGNG